MEKVLILHSNMELGGAETSLIGLLHSIDYQKVSVDLALMEQKGELLSLIPQEVNLLEMSRRYKALGSPIKNAIKEGQLFIVAARILAKIICALKTPKSKYSDYGYIMKQWSHYMALPFLPELSNEYDIAISFNDPHFILGDKIQANVKVGWFHTDFSRIMIYPKLEEKMWNNCDKIVNVSESCKRAFDKKHVSLEGKSIVIENILSKKLLLQQADAFSVEKEMQCSGVTKILSIGRFSEQKNFDNIPDICKRILSKGVLIKWYIIGYGGAEQLIRERIKEANVEEYVVILGKKENPYPYIKNCDIYVQPSRYEGKCVAVREAQILEKPVIITDYKTADSQLVNGVDGVVVPLDNEQCAEGIIKVITNRELQRKLIRNIQKRDYTNCSEVNKIYQLMEG